jgi:NADPH2:quinone reductase
VNGWMTEDRTGGTVRGLAAVFLGERAIRLEPVLVPPPEPGQVRVKLEGCGVCASNLPVWEGRPWFRYPLPPGAPGHEGWGRIDAVGSGVEGLGAGQRVALLSEHAYAEYERVDADRVLPLPDSLDGSDFPGEPLGCVMNILNRSGIRAGETVAVVGIGFLGALLVQLAAQAGARVIALSRRPYALEIARRQGAAATIGCNDLHEAVRRARRLTDDLGCDCVIEAAGEQATLDLATELTRTRGRLVIAGYHQDGLRHLNLQLWNWRGLDVINAHEREPAVCRAGLDAAVQAVAAGRLDPAPLYTHRFRLDELPMAFHLMRERPDGFMKGVLVL